MRFRVLLALPVLALLLAACGDNGDGDGAAATTTSSAPTTTTAEGVELSQTCDAPRYQLRYPEGWSTNPGDVVPVCRFFHPEPFTVPASTEVLDLAVIFDVETVPFERIVEAAGGREEEILDERDLTVDGQDAVRVEARATGGGLVPDGVPSLRYVVDLGGSSSLVATTFGLEGLDHSRNRDVLDAMIDTVDIEDEPGCSAAGFPSEPAAQELPDPVAETRRAIVAAATECDFDRLAEIARDGTFTYSFGDDGDPAAYWREQEESGDPLQVLVELLQRPYATRPAGDETQYVWPRAYAYERWEEVPADARAELEPLYGPDDFDDFARFGSYTGYRVGISTDGDWQFFVAGD